MGGKQLLQSGNKQPCIMDRFIFIRGIGFLLNDDFRMLVKESLIIEVDVSDNAQAIGNNAEFIGIAEMAVNVELFNVRIRGGMGRHGAISSLIRVVAVIKMHGFCVGFELFDDTVGILGVIFRNPGFYAGRIKDGHICPTGINGQADWLSKVNQTVKNGLDIFKEALLKPGDFRSIRNLVKTTEFTEMPRIAEKNKEQGIGRDRKNPLDDESP